jgi:hypothetical protein
MDQNKRPRKFLIVPVKNVDFWDIWDIIVGAVKKLRDKTGVILFGSLVLLTLWGQKGGFAFVFPIKYRDAWLGTGLAWRDELITFIAGFVLLIMIPCIYIKLRKEKLGAYGLGWPKEKNLRKLAVYAFIFLFILGTVSCLFGITISSAMRDEYPLFTDGAITGWSEFLLYESVYLIFFISIEFIFRGFQLFGLHSVKDSNGSSGIRGAAGPLIFGKYAILIQMLAYTMWHIYKPWPEYFGALAWGIIAAAIALKIRTIWPIIAAHWLSNVVMDIALWLGYKS